MLSSFNIQVILTDGDPYTLKNMKKNMELNNICIKQEDSIVLKGSNNKVSQFRFITQSIVCRWFLSYVIDSSTVELDGAPRAQYKINALLDLTW